ncbi:hypothetical protein R6Q59_013734 [Mikania micrantha]
MIFGKERNILPLAPPGQSVYLLRGALSVRTTEKDLENLFSRQGKVTRCIVVKHSNGHSKGFGFVTFDRDSLMKSSIQRLDGCLLHCRHIKVAPSQFRGEK